ncbi:MAG: polysaccharide biosynthesis C-terminal domain-containing protein, partial [Phycisphaerae bacterium]|nr:polysaccharide biosynthesis C-terminal domain-containing protein [Phycisphaerae bacterium]
VFAGTCVALTLLLALPLGVMVFAYGTLVGTAKIAIWAALAQTFWQCQETVRRTLFARGGYARALPGDIISYLGQAAIIALLAFSGHASVSYALIAIAVTSLAACLIQARQLRIKLGTFAEAYRTSELFFRMGRWVLVANLSTLVSGVCCTFSLARTHGQDKVGQFFAVLNLLRLANPVLIALSSLIIPAVALAASKHGTKNLREAIRVTERHTIHGLLLLTPYWLILLILPQHALRIFYPHRPDYYGLGFELRLLVLNYIVQLVVVVLGAMLNGFNRSRRVLAAQLLGTAASALVTIPLIFVDGLRGLLIGTVISNSVIAISLVYLLYRLHRQLARETA